MLNNQHLFLCLVLENVGILDRMDVIREDVNYGGNRKLE